MKKHTRLWLLLIFAIWVSPLAAIAAHAADGANVLNDASALESPWAALIIAITPILVAAIKAIAPRIPTWLVPISASLIGCVLAFAGSYFAGVDVNWWQGLLLGLGGVGLREILNQIAKPHKTVLENDHQPSYGEGEGDT